MEISEKKKKNLLDKMKRLGINENDIVEKFIRSGGPGGQKVNKTSSCVYLKHIPTGIEVKCSSERSRAVNRFLARRNLARKIEEMVLGKKSEKQKQIEKIRRQKRKRSRRAKEKILEEKKKQSQKKKSRAYARKMKDD
jgi:protein subunit release factor B